MTPVHPAAGFPGLVEKVEAALKAPLPGARAQAVMAPRPARQWPPGMGAMPIRDAAALLLLFPIDGRAHLVVTVRSETLEQHGGQVSLPGGAVDTGETLEAAAMREAREEIGLDTAIVRALGALTPIDVHVSRFRLHPVVAAAPVRPGFAPAAGEVARILEIPLDALAHPDSVASRLMIRDNRDVEVPFYAVGGVEIWGATAMILAEFLALIREFEELR